MSPIRTHTSALLLWLVLVAPFAHAQQTIVAPVGEATERQLPSDEPARLWARDPNALDMERGDTLEPREVQGVQPKTVKLKNVVPPIHFESGVADIPPSTVDALRGVLERMRDLPNVRLHLVGHADSQPLSDRLAGIFGDNEGLSHERAGQVAEFLQNALGLAPETIAFEWAGDSDPIATNDTEEGRAKNRRVEVEVWYDESESKTSLEEVVVPG